MIEHATSWISLLAGMFFLPPLLLGTINKVRARLQNRQGASLLQPFFDLLKLCRKDETLSQSSSWIFRGSTVLNFVLTLLLSLLLPWLSSKPIFPGDDIFFVLYLMALIKLFSILSSLDTGSPFAAFGASRESTLTLLVEPSSVLSFVALGILQHTSSLSVIFSAQNAGADNTIVWLLVGVAICISSLVEMSRMPVDDPATHLELTMVHEAMILEASGRNLALLIFTNALKLTILVGLICQCFIHAAGASLVISSSERLLFSFLGILALGIILGVFESLSVKLRWRKIPEFIAYSLTMSFLACLISISGGLF